MRVPLLRSPGGSSSYAQGLIACGGSLFFAAADAAHGFEMWVSDGSPDGTRLLQDLTPGSASTHVSDIACVDGELRVRALPPRACRPQPPCTARVMTPCARASDRTCALCSSPRTIDTAGAPTARGRTRG